MANNIKEEIDDKVMDCINAGVTGRLIIVKPEKNIFGADLAVERRGNYKEGAIYFQINSVIGPAEKNIFTKDFLQESFKADRNFYLFFIYFDEIRQKIGDFIWLIPSMRFKDIAKIIKSPDGKKAFRFQAPLDVKIKNEYSKFVVNSKDLGKTILDALEKGNKFNFDEKGYGEEKMINSEELKEFLCEARRNTYAANASSIGNQRLLASYQLEFQRRDYSYIDVYFLGSKRFMGQEIVYQESKPIWGMNYIGSQIGKLETAFLKDSLFKLSDKCRLGGNCEYEKREFKYKDEGQGNLDSFSGHEEIYLDGKNIYNLDYKGGIISDKL